MQQTVSLVEASARMVARRREEKASIRRFKERAAGVFAQHPEGMRMNDLIEVLRQEHADPDIAYACVDSLRTTGVAHVNLSTGMMTHRQGAS